MKRYLTYKPDYLIVCTHDLAVALTQRPHHLIKYLARTGKKVTFLHLRHLYEPTEDKKITLYTQKGKNWRS